MRVQTISVLKIVSFFTIAKIWKQPEGLMSDEWIENVVLTNNRTLFELKNIRNFYCLCDNMNNSKNIM